MSASSPSSRLRIAWLWNEVYKGLSVEWNERKQLLWLGWTTREYKRRGW
jgi:hypothetical protein